ncbi:YqaJ viral recombinase family protein [Aeromicrobium sp. HA]|uniref:YqaJ viral recombinase family protein n=1 Tax=Aeromicrobium sp. HA TaxID=3009077 RepID=UPI0022AEF736|nr:YqaJ viral recombinase family protein [Aeromicrobium sp. HA]
MVTASVISRLLTVSAPGATAYDCPECDAAAGTPCVSLARTEPQPIKTPHRGRVELAAHNAPSAPPVIEVADNDTSRGLTLTLVAERLSGMTEDTHMTSDMWRGVEAEPHARDAYSEHHKPATEVGFMIRDDWGFQIGFSPDGLVGDDGFIEIKAPRAKTHVLTVIEGRIPEPYMAQIQAGLLVSGRAWCDYIPFVGGMPLWTKRVHPDPAWHDAIVAAVRAFETNAAELTEAYLQATTGLPVTERIEPPLEMVI